MERNLNTAEVVYVKPDRVKIAVSDIVSFKEAEDSLKVGSYLQIIDEHEEKVLIAIIDSFSIEIERNKGSENSLGDDEEISNEFDRKYIIEASPLGVIEDGKFTRGGDTLSIPPKDVKPASIEYIKDIFENSVDDKVKFVFSKLANNDQVKVPVDGNKFFNKHLAIVGASGSGKSHTVAKIFQKAIELKENTESDSLNNSHIIIFDIHSEYSTAFHNPNVINVENLNLPYWMLNDDELEELFLESGDRNNYNQASVLRGAITANKIKYANNNRDIYFDSPVKFNIEEVMRYLKNISVETVNSKDKNRFMIEDGSYSIDNLITNSGSGIQLDNDQRYLKYFEKEHKFYETKNSNITKGNYADGTLDKFFNRMESKINDKRLTFLFGDNSFSIEFEEIIKKLLGYGTSNSNVTIIDLSGVPFEVLSITVSLISRILFEVGYNKKKYFKENNTPLMIVYEEAHKYAPRSNMAKYRSSTTSIERIAKEGRKYGVTLCIVSQRPSEISETIFSQCNNFVAMRLTNPDDQNYVKRLLPDSLEGVTASLPSLQTGQAIVIGDSIIMPSVVSIEECDSERSPSSLDIKFIEEWKKEWLDIDFSKLKEIWS